MVTGDGEHVGSGLRDVAKTLPTPFVQPVSSCGF